MLGSRSGIRGTLTCVFVVVPSVDIENADEIGEEKRARGPEVYFLFWFLHLLMNLNLIINIHNLFYYS